jgi:hypothetical protein
MRHSLLLYSSYLTILHSSHVGPRKKPQLHLLKTRRSTKSSMLGGNRSELFTWWCFGVLLQIRVICQITLPYGGGIGGVIHPHSRQIHSPLVENKRLWGTGTKLSRFIFQQGRCNLGTRNVCRNKSIQFRVQISTYSPIPFISTDAKLSKNKIIME